MESVDRTVPAPLFYHSEARFRRDIAKLFYLFIYFFQYKEYVYTHKQTRERTQTKLCASHPWSVETSARQPSSFYKDENTINTVGPGVGSHFH